VSGKPSGFATGSQNPVARDDQGDGILSQCLSHGSRCVGPMQGSGELAVRPGLSGGDFASGFVYQPRERIRRVQVNGDVSKILNFTEQVLAYFLDDLSDANWRFARFAHAGVPRDSAFGQFRGFFGKL